MRRRILLADDSVTIQKVIELTFMDEDYEVRAVSNGDEAIQALPEADPDFVIADVHMPGANGYEVCRRSKQRKASVPVLLLVGTFEPFDEAQARAAGADSYLKKPFDSQELLQRVGELLAAAPAAALPAASPAIPLAIPLGTETVRLAAVSLPLTSSPEPVPAPPPAPPAPPAIAEEWRGFELEPEPLEAPGASALEIGDEQPFVLEEPAAAWQGTADTYLPEGEQMFELEEEPAIAAAAPPPIGDVFAFEPEPLPAPAAPGSFEALTSVEDHLFDVERAGSLAETEHRIESPPPPAVAQSHEPQTAPAAATPAPAPAPLAVGRIEVNGGLSDADVDRIARRVVELLGDKAVRDVAWEVIPDLAEVVIRDRLRELESQTENLE
jgi:CheY-like chemotaxis protein